MRIISMHLSHPPPRMRDANPTVDVPLALEQVALQALEKQRGNRFASATAFLQALEDSEAVVEESEPFEMGATVPNLILGAAAAHTPAARRSRALATVSLLAFAALSVAGIVVVRGRMHRSTGAAGLSARPTAPAPAAPALATEFKKVEALLEEGNTVGARVALEDQLAHRPKDARIHYMLGRLAFADNRHADGLASYREAIDLDDGFRGDPVLLAHVDTALGEPRQAQAALDLVIDKIGPPAADLLEKVANEGPDLARRHRAATALESMGKGERVDRTGLLVLELKKAQTCEDRKDLVEKLRVAGDPRALPALKALRPRGGLGRLMSRLGANGGGIGCMKKELADAIKELEEKT